MHNHSIIIIIINAKIETDKNASKKRGLGTVHPYVIGTWRIVVGRGEKKLLFRKSFEPGTCHFRFPPDLMVWTAFRFISKDVPGRSIKQNLLAGLGGAGDMIKLTYTYNAVFL